MKIVVTEAVASSASSPAAPLGTAGAAVRVRQWADSAGATYAAAGQRLRRAVSYRREALEHWLGMFVLELLAAIVLVALLIVMTDPATREDC